MATQSSSTRREEEGMGPMERGRRRYQKKDFEGALKAFSEAVKISTGHMLLTALDHRAATCEKLDQLQSALRDSKQMIELKPEISKGYLRCGKILQLMENQDLALKIYERGLRKVKIGTDEDRTVLQTMFNKLQQRQTPRRTLDPLAMLPTELIVMICEKLEMRDRVICLSLSKAWKRTLESSYKLWTFLNTRPARRAFGQKSLRAYLRRSNYTLDKAWITMGPENRGGFNDARLSYLTRTCQKLQDLEISGPGIIGDSLTNALPLAKNLQTLIVHKNCEVPLDSILSVLDSNRSSLREVSFLAIQASFRSLTMEWPAPVFDSIKILRLRALSSDGRKPRLNIDDLVEAFPNVEHVLLHEWSISPSSNVNLKPWTRLKHLDLESIGLGNLPLLPSTLEHLNISHNIQLGRGGEKDHTRLPLLRTFNCYSTNLDSWSVGNIIKPSIEAGNLRTLSVGGGVPELPGPSEIEKEYPASQNIEDISLANMNLSEQRALQIVNQYPNLKRIELSGSKITGVAVKHFVQMGVTYLKVNECAQIGADAIAYARSMGVEVIHTFSSGSAVRRTYVSRMQELY